MSRLNKEMHPLLTAENVEDLHCANLFTVTDFLKADIKRITSSSSLSYKDVVLLKKHIANKNAAVIRNGLTYYKEMLSKCALISSGIRSLDSLLEGGFLTGQIYEFCGLPSTGKTQLCMTITKNVATLKRNVFYLDTKGDFSGRRFKEMLENSENISQDQIPHIMGRVLIKQILSKHDLITSLYHIKKEILEGLRVRFIIIDSLPAIFYHDSSSHVETNGMLNQLANILRFLAVECHVAIVLTNIVTVWYESEFATQSFSATTEKVGLGKYWLAIPNLRLTLRRKEDSSSDITIHKYNLNNSEKVSTLTIKGCGVT